MADVIPASSAELLAAQAKSGLDGVAAYKQAQQTLTDQRQSAVQQAMQEAALRGAPVGAASSQQSIISAPYDQRLASLAQGQAGFEADMAGRDRRMADYNAATLQARTLIPGEVEKVVAPIRAQGEANIANTTRQGEMAVSEIDANTRLALAKMRAEAEAARIAAAKKAAEDAAKERKLSGTDLEAMLANEATSVMNKSIGDIGTAVQTNEAAAQAAAAAKTKMNPNVYVTSFGAAAAPKLKQATIVGQNGLATPLNGATTYSLSTGATAVPKLQQATVTHQATPQQKRAGGIATGTVIAGGDTLGTAEDRANVPVWRTQGGAPGWGTQRDGASLGGAGPAVPKKPSAPVTIPWGPPAPQSIQWHQNPLDVARTIAAIQQGQSPAPPELSRSDMQQWLSKYGSMSQDQIKSLISSDPYAASLITGSPVPITSGTIDQMLYGQPDQTGNADPYSVTAASTARQIARDRLRAAGYDISDKDFANATTETMKPGESLATYQRRVSGQKDPEDPRKQFADNVKYNQLASQYDAQGNPLTEENNVPLSYTAEQKNKAYDELATQWITGTSGMQMPSGSSFGGPQDIMAAMQGGGDGATYVSAYNALANNSGGVGFDTDQWKDQLKKLKDKGANLTPIQVAMLKSIFYVPSLDNKN